MIDWWSDLSPHRAAGRLTDQLYLSGEVVGWHHMGVTKSLAPDWLTVRRTDGRRDWLTDWMMDWLPDWLAGWLADWLTGWPTDRLTDWLTDGRTDWITEWLITGCLSDWSRGCIRGYMKDLPRDWHSVVCPRNAGTWSSFMEICDNCKNNHHSIPCWSNAWLRIQ